MDVVDAREAEKSPSTQRLDSLQALRGLAALLVMLLHAIQMTAAFAGYDDVTRNGLVPIGSFGVDIFFVLSGVVIAMLVARNGNNRQSPGGFAFRRAAKLLPTFWVTLGLMALILQAPASGVSSLLSRPLSLLLLEPQSTHVPAWTLLFEAHFYIVAAAALCFPSRAMTVMLIWVPLQVAAVVLAMADLIPMHPFLRPPSLELCAGLLIGIVAPRWQMPMPALVAFGAVGVVLIEATLFPALGNGDANPMRLPMYGIPAGVLVYALLSLERSGWKPPRMAVKLGEISFSLYMWHIPVMLILAMAMVGCKGLPLGVLAFGVLSRVVNLGGVGNISGDRGAGDRVGQPANAPRTRANRCCSSVGRFRCSPTGRSTLIPVVRSISQAMVHPPSGPLVEATGPVLVTLPLRV